MALSMTVRRTFFSFGVVSILVSIGVLIGSYTREVKSTDYLQQARDAVPWILWGGCSALLGSTLCSFGKGVYRGLGISIGAILAMIWLMLGGSAV